MKQPIVFRDDITIKIDRGGVSFTLGSRDYKGVQCVVQKTTGTLSPGAHAGSYNGQDAYNDMLITDELFNATDRTVQRVGPGIGFEGTRPQGCDRLDYRGGCQEMTQEIKTVVRRLTPTECERLQGFPDGWTDLGDWTDSKGKVHKEADSPRYKALGNSIATPFWFYLLRRIAAQYERPATLGSLFDGIGGFPLCWEKCNGPGTALWASEIEEFCIAVTKKHFGED